MKNYIKYLTASFMIFTLITVFCACGDSDNKVSDDVASGLSSGEISSEGNNDFENTPEDNIQDKTESITSNEQDTSFNEEVVDTTNETSAEHSSGVSDDISQDNIQDEAESEASDKNVIIEDTEIQESTAEISTPVIESDVNTDYGWEVIKGTSVNGASIEVIDGITYVNGILIVNKTYPLPDTYAPQYDGEVLNSLNRMFSDASAVGHTLKVKSGYRSYIDQKIIYNSYVAKDGKALADTYSARPGHSEHQSGLAFDLNQLLKSFGDTPEGIWLAQNCHKYGFIIRYPKGKESITGYMYEPWHVRYLGVDMATKVYESGLCLEEYLGITSEYSY